MQYIRLLQGEKLRVKFETMTIIEEKCEASISGDVKEAKSLLIVMNGTYATKFPEYCDFVETPHNQRDESWAKKLGAFVKEKLPMLREIAKSNAK